MSSGQTVTKICIAGASGKVGRLIVSACRARSAEFSLVSAYSRTQRDTSSPQSSRDDLTHVLTDDFEHALAAQPDVLIDYTHPTSVKSHVEAALARGIHCVIGTSGLTTADFTHIDALARANQVGAVSGNFSLTASLLQHFAKIAAGYIDDWEIIESAPASKPDVPSGTARELAEVLHRRADPAERPALIGWREARGAAIGDTHVHAIRLPGNTRSIDLIFGLPGEKLVLRHEEDDPSVFVRGTLYAARKVIGICGLVRGLDVLMFRHDGPGNGLPSRAGL